MLASVVIPALNEAENITHCIAAARREYTPQEVELLVADGGSTDDTLELIPPGVPVVASPRGRAVQMNAGAAASRGEILAFCHADSLLPAGWREAVIEALNDPQVSGGTFQTFILPAESRLLHWRNCVALPAQWRGMFGDQVQFMRRATFEAVGGFPEIPLMEDVEMSRALHRRGRLVRIDPAIRVTTSSRRFRERGALRQTLLNGWNLFRYLYLGASPEAIARTYRSTREETLE